MIFKQKDQEKERSAAVEAILKSNSRNKIVVAGPGTGKTYLFRKICEATTGDILAITFINNLAIDLRNELADFAECSTFHALCKKQIYKIPVPTISKFAYFPKIDVILNADKMILKPELGDLREAFELFLPNDDRVGFFLQRAHYYGAVGHTDGVLQVILFLEEKPDSIPCYAQILVDEYQDFNNLEVKMIEVLSHSSPTLIVGDDDQALYDFKHATPQFLRNLAESDEYDLFSLPYCSRCTQVVVEATNQIVNHASNSGLLAGRIQKPFECFLPAKDEDNKRYPKLIHATCSVHNSKASYVTQFIINEIDGIVESGYRPEFNTGVWDFIIAGPRHYLRGLADSLEEKFPYTFQSLSDKGDLKVTDCYLELIRNIDSDIGWRSVMTQYEEETLVDLVMKSKSENVPFRNLVPRGIKQDVLHTLQILSKLKEQKTVDAFEETKLIEVFDLNIETISAALGFIEMDEKKEQHGTKHSIRVSSMLGCKGLTANYTFIVGLDNGILPVNPDSLLIMKSVNFWLVLPELERNVILFQ